jgi:ADP-heptose:LPS heptosyltransferase
VVTTECASFENCLVIRGGAIGDFILTLPVFRTLRHAAPRANIEVLGYPRIASLAVDSGLARQVASIESRGLESFFVAGADLPEAWTTYFNRFDLIVSYLFDPHAVFSANVASVSGARYVPGCYRPTEGMRRHASDQLLEPLATLGLQMKENAPGLSIDVQDPDPTRLAVHPGSGSERKNWPIEAWEELLGRLLRTNRDLGLSIVGGEADGERVDRLCGALPAGRTEVYFERPLKEVAQCLAGCGFYLGHDSGISHLAAAVGCRGLVLWGPTDADTWRPRSNRIEIMQAGNDLRSLPVDSVYGAYARSTGMRPV